jgi:hypothetical protein
MSIQLFTDLAGSQFLTIPAGLDALTILNLISEYKSTFQNKVKVIFDNYDPIFISNLFADFAKDSNFNIEVNPYNSNFFVFDKNQSKIWLDYNPLQGFVTEEILYDDMQNIEIIKNLLVNSFAVKMTKDADSKTVVENDSIRSRAILDKFDISYNQQVLKTFLVKSESDEIVGCYSMIKVGNEVQLSSVAGRANMPNSFKGKKLVVLCQAMISSFLAEPEFSDTEYLTLSNSKKPVAQMYSDLNILKNNSRKGLLVQMV